ncbi:LacI family DNA-binding transcriptional regulator [Thermostaphylospora chromogena]
MADVAKVAGVSHQTVSRVLNNHPNVRGETRDRVLRAIEQLGYRRNFAARALVTRRSRTLGVISFDTTLYGPASTVHGIEQAARVAGYFVTIVSLKSIDRSGMREAVDYLVGRGVAGLVVVAAPRSAVHGLTVPDGIPLVSVHGTCGKEEAVVGVDQVAGARLAVEHLLRLGHRTVWHITGPADWPETEGRLAGWRAALAEAGQAAPEPLPGDWSPRAGYQAGRRLAATPGVSAVFVANDQMALGVLRALAEEGVKVPEQISVVGFDDIPEAEFFSPPLTTVRQDFDAVGRRSIEVLLRQIEKGEPFGPGPLVVSPRLIIRASTSPAR